MEPPSAFVNPALSDCIAPLHTIRFLRRSQAKSASPKLWLANKPEAEIVRRDPDCAATSLGVPDEVGDIGPMWSLDDAHTTIGALRDNFADVIQHVAHEARAGPFPDVAADILQVVFIEAEAS